MLNFIIRLTKKQKDYIYHTQEDTKPCLKDI